MYKSLEDMLVAAAEAIRPPERMTVSQAAVKYREIRNPGSFVGKWDPSFAPYLDEIMDCFTRTDIEATIFAGPARCGKSDGLMNWLTYSAKCDPADMMVVHMTQSTAREWSNSDLRKALTATPVLKELLVPGKQNDNVYDKKFTSGMRLIVKWPTITELSGKTIPRCWIMDLDRMEDDIDNEGSPFFLTLKRNETFGRFGMTVAESSPGRPVLTTNWIPATKHEAPPVSGGILPLYNTGDRRRWYWQCVNCKVGFEPSFALLDWPRCDDPLEAAEQASLLCPHCSHRYWHDPAKQGGSGPSKREMNQLLARGGHATWLKDGEVITPEGEIAGKPTRSQRASFWLKGPAAAFSTWQKLVFNYLKAEEQYEKSGEENDLKVTINVDQGEPYTFKSTISARVPETLKNRARDMGQRKVPIGTRFLIATVDVQKNRFIVQVQGVGVGGDLYVVDRFAIRKANRRDAAGEREQIDPGAYLEDWKVLITDVIEQSYPLVDGSGRTMAIKHVFCDSGGREGVTKNAYDFWRYLREDHETPGYHGRFRLIKGHSTRTAPRVKLEYPDSARKDRNAGARGEIPVLMLNSNVLKDGLNHMLDRTDPEGGMIHFPDWLDDSFYVELTVETRNAKGEWENKARKRNESWDLLYYCIGGLLWNGIGIDYIDWKDPPSWAREWEDNDLVFVPTIDPPPFAAKPKEDFDFAKLAQNLA